MIVRQSKLFFKNGLVVYYPCKDDNEGKIFLLLFTRFPKILIVIVYLSFERVDGSGDKYIYSYLFQNDLFRCCIEISV